MSVNRLDRVNALLLREIADDLFRVLQSEPEVDVAGITVTKVECAPNLRSADVWVSIMDAAEHPTWLRRLSKHAKEIQTLINRNMTLHYTPKLRFRLDTGIAKGDRVLDILNHLEIPQDAETEQ
ncbi:MAG: 30S ribosome-binding factor RbfA [Kiritimatiellae bacterium]|jgi:ribosome-binding factor A|nr:30S ribosome-binding factor RbfA [Kiritimatiellia bacterium]